MPISAILFGGRRASVVPLVHEAFDWAHGVFLGAIMASETTAAATGAVGELRRDPFAMLPFCGYNMADYWAHWLSFEDRMDEAKLPRVFYVNWFRKSADGRCLVARLRGELPRARVGLRTLRRPRRSRRDAYRLPPGARRRSTPKGSTSQTEDMIELLRVDRDEWRAELPSIVEYFAQFGDRLPPTISDTDRGAPPAPRLTLAGAVPLPGPAGARHRVGWHAHDQRSRAVRGEHRIVAGVQGSGTRPHRPWPASPPRQHPHVGALGRVRYRVDLHLEAFALGGRRQHERAAVLPTSTITARLGPVGRGASRAAEIPPR